MKIVVLNNFYFPFGVGGAEESLRLQLEALAAIGVSSSVLTVAHDGVPARSIINGVEVNYVRSRFVSGSPLSATRNALRRLGWQFGGILQLAFAWQVLRAFRRIRPDALYVNNLAGIGRSAILIARLFGIPVIAALRDYSWVCLRQSRFKKGISCSGTCLECRIGCFPRRSVARSITAVASNSQSILDIVRENGMFRSTTGTVIYAGASRSDHRTRLPGDIMVLGVMGQIQETKGVDELLTEVAALGREGRLRILVAGSVKSEYAKRIQRKWDENWVTFAGRMEKEAFFDEVDIVVIPSLWNEPLSRVTYEAFSAGKCVIASCHGGQKEVIQDGYDGYIYRPLDGSLSVRLVELLASRDTVSRIGECARVKSQSFTPEVAANDFRGLLNRMTNRV